MEIVTKAVTVIMMGVTIPKMNELEKLQRDYENLLNDYRKVVKQRNHYKKVSTQLKKEKFLDYSEEEFSTIGHREKFLELMSSSRKKFRFLEFRPKK
jgi:hypothetical protein